MITLEKCLFCLYAIVQLSAPLYEAAVVLDTSPIQDCGRKRESTTPLIRNGTEVKAGHYPWVAAIFQKRENNFLFVCSGTMLTQKIIVTGAHCLVDSYDKINSAERMAVGVGKFHTKFNDERDAMAQYSEVQKILAHPNYLGDSLHYASDIAFLITKDTFVLSQVVHPACFSNLPSIYLTSRSEGVVAGWGYAMDESPASEELTDVPVSYMDRTTCYSTLPAYWLDKYYVYDKLCAGHLNSTTKACRGSGGNGLVFKNPEDGRFYFHGILSVGRISPNKKCLSESISLYTNVSLHYDWLKQIVTQYN